MARQLITEGLLLAAIGGAAGFLCAVWASKGLTAIIFEEYVVTVAFDPAPDGRVVAFTMVTATLFGLLLTLLPAWQATREQPLGLQQRTARTVTSAAVGPWLVAAQIALSLVLSIAAGLFVRTLQTIRAVPSGLTSAGVVVAYSFPRPEGYRHVDNDATTAARSRSSKRSPAWSARASRSTSPRGAARGSSSA